VKGKLGLRGALAGVPMEGRPKTEFEWERKSGDGFGGSTDVVFAYRLREIWRRGEKVGTREFNRGAFMSMQRKKGEEVDGEMVVDVGERDVDVEDLDDEEGFKFVEADEEGENCVCIFA